MSLRDRSVVVTRAPEQAGELEKLLADGGATVISFPTISIADPVDGGAALRAALEQLHTYDWIVFTSANTVERTFLELIMTEVKGIGKTKVAAIGSATARAIIERGIKVDVMPENAVAEGLLTALLESPGGRRVLLPRAAIGRDILPNGLRAAGFEVDVVEAYRTVQGEPTAEARAAVPNADAVVFTSPSTVTGFVALAPKVDLLAACIGPVTSTAAAKAGFTRQVKSTDASAAAIVKTLEEAPEAAWSNS